MESDLRNLDEYKSLKSTLENAGKPGMVVALDRFVIEMATESFQGLSDAQLKDNVFALSHDLDEAPMRVEVTAYIDGISISESPIVISDQLTLRRPVAEDMAEYVTLDELGGFSFPKAQTWFDVIGVFVSEAMSTGLVQQEFIRWLDALRLFRVGAVVSCRYVMKASQTFRQPVGGMLSGPGKISRQSYVISVADAGSLKNFIRDIAPRLPGILDPNRSVTEKEIAFARYNDALFQSGPSEQVITSAVTALEALFPNKEDQELSHRLAQRVSVLLRFLGSHANAMETVRKMKKGYGIRSTFIHGGSLPAKDRPEADALAPVLLDYVRVCVLTFLQITISKETLIRQLDRVMIDPAGIPDVQDSLQSVTHR
jgi:hypothetical protein